MQNKALCQTFFSPLHFFVDKLPLFELLFLFTNHYLINYCINVSIGVGEICLRLSKSQRLQNLLLMKIDT